MKNKKRKLLILSILFCVFSIGFITSYAFFHYSGSTNKLVISSGEVDMYFDGPTNEITYTAAKAYPTSRKNIMNTNSSFDFTIGYGTTSDKDISYEINLEYGDSVDGKTRIDDKYLRFDLFKYDSGSTTSGEYVFVNQSFDSINKKTITTGTISHQEPTTINTYLFKDDYDEDVCYDVLEDFRLDPDSSSLKINFLKNYCTKKGTYFSYLYTLNEEEEANIGYLQSLLNIGWYTSYVYQDDDGLLITDDEDAIDYCVNSFSNAFNDTEVNPIWTTFCKGESDSGIFATFTITDYLNETKPYLVSPLEDEINYYLDHGIISGTTGNYIYNTDKAEELANYFMNNDTALLNDGWGIFGKTLYDFSNNTPIGNINPWYYSAYYDMMYPDYSFTPTIMPTREEQEELYNQGVLKISSTTLSSNYDSVTYKLRMWVSDEVTICAENCTYTQEEWNNLYATIKVSGYGDYTVKADINYDLPLYYTLLSDAVNENEASTYVTSSSGIDLTTPASSTNGNGIYITSSTINDIYPVYYVRGITKKVIFADYCWDVIRSTDNGGIKLLYSGIPSGGKCLTSSSIGTSKYNEKSNSMAYVGYYYGYIKEQQYLNKNDYSGNLAENIYAGTAEYIGGTYVLIRKSQLSSTTDWSTSYSLPISSKTKYTCLSSSTTCDEVYYIMDTDENGFYYLKLNNGKILENVINDMTIYSSNETPSTIATMINNWYMNNLTSYTSKLEDAFYCNYRSGNTLYNTFKDKATNTGVAGGFYYGINNANSTLTCSANDAFSVDALYDSSSVYSNGNLTYPIGLITYEEANLMGIKSNTNTYWTMTPHNYNYDGTATVKVVSNTSDDFMNSYSDVDVELDVRPVITLKFGVTLKRGTGTSESPYIIN